VTVLRRRYRTLIAIAVIVAIVLIVRRLDLPEVGRVIKGADWRPFAAAAALVVAPLALRSLRAIYVFRSAGHGHVPPSSLAAITVLGFSLSSVTPGGAGDLLRAAPLSRYGVPVRDSTAIVIYERVIDLTAVLLLLAAALLVTLAPAPLALGVLLVFAAVAVVVASALRRWLPAVAGLFNMLSAIGAPMVPGPAVAAALLRPRTLVAMVAFTLPVFALEALRGLLVVRALGLDLNLGEVWVVLAISSLAGLLTLLPLGVGSWEAAAIWIFGLYGVDANAGAAGALLLRAGITLPSLLAGALAWTVAARLRAPLAGREGAVDYGADVEPRSGGPPSITPP
jgi:uncharacterized membrane protein YbhN (UPF0104 family)